MTAFTYKEPAPGSEPAHQRGADSRQIIAIITSAYEIRKILRHLVKIGKSPPGVSVDV